MGILASMSHLVRVSRLIPFPSHPATSTKGSFSNPVFPTSLSPSPSSPITEYPIVLSFSKVRFRFYTLITFINAHAPALAFQQAAFTEALRLWGIITPSAPKAAADLIMAPRFC